jgi:hypothetical protein
MEGEEKNTHRFRENTPNTNAGGVPIPIPIPILSPPHNFSSVNLGMEVCGDVWWLRWWRRFVSVRVLVVVGI